MSEAITRSADDWINKKGFLENLIKKKQQQQQQITKVGTFASLPLKSENTHNLDNIMVGLILCQLWILQEGATTLGITQTTKNTCSVCVFIFSSSPHMPNLENYRQTVP